MKDAVMTIEEMAHLRKQLRSCNPFALKVLNDAVNRCVNSFAWDEDDLRLFVAHQLQNTIANAEVDIRRKEVGKLRLKGTIVPAFPVIL